MEVALELETGRDVENERHQRRGFLPDDAEGGGWRFGSPQEGVAYDGLSEGARGLRQGHAAALLTVGQVAHHPVVEGVAEFVGEGYDVAGIAAVGHVDPRRARLRKAGAVGAGALCRPHRALDPALVGHHADKGAHLGIHGSVGVGDEFDGFGIGDGFAVAIDDGCWCTVVPGPVPALAVGPGLQLGGAPGERNPLFGDLQHRVESRLADPVHVQRCVEIVHGRAGRQPDGPLAAHFQTPAGDGVDCRCAGLLVFVPGCVDGAPGTLAQVVVGLVHQSGRLGHPHGLQFVVHHHLAAKRAGELVVEAAPGVKPVPGEAGDQVLLVQGQEFMATLARMFHRKPGGCGGGRREVALDHLRRRKIEELARRFGYFGNPFLDRLHTA